MKVKTVDKKMQNEKAELFHGQTRKLDERRNNRKRRRKEGNKKRIARGTYEGGS